MERGAAVKPWQLVACVIAACGVSDAAGLVLTPDGLGTTEIGTSASQMERMLRQKILPVGEGCVVVAADDGRFPGISYVIEDKRVSRINVDYYGNSEQPLAIRTAAGIGLGSTEDDVKKAYGDRVRIEPNPGDPTWHYLYVDEPDHARGLAFDTDGKTVKSMHSGTYPALGYKQGCS